jgi:benzodiazapine receptor
MLTLKKYRPEIFGALFCLSLGLLSGYLSQSGESNWYIHLKKPSFNPPSWIFAPVWTLLYLMMGIALGKLWKLRELSSMLLKLFAIQFLLNLLWSPLFFYFHQIDLALVCLFLLWLFLLSFMTLARRVRVVYILFAPYLLWVSFALALNYSIYRLNI